MNGMLNKTVFNLTDISKIYPNGTAALQDINLTVNQGDFFTLVGPSGCGKSTILRLVANLEKPSKGYVNWNRDYDNSLAFVFQEPALMPWATVFANIYLPLKLTKVNPRYAHFKCNSAINLVGLQGFENVYPRELSGGMKMRVSIARALVTEPNIAVFTWMKYKKLGFWTRGQGDKGTRGIRYQQSFSLSPPPLVPPSLLGANSIRQP